LATTVDAKLAIIEAAMKAQTSALETKLDLLEAAIKALPDYSDQLEAIAAAVEAIPDYSDKLAALETALEAIAENIEAQEGQYADELAALTDAIDAIKSEVAAGNKSQEEALAEIIALLESGAIAGGGSGSGSGGEGSGGEGSGGEGSGGEGSGDEPTDPHISFTTEKPKGSTIQFTCAGEVKSISGVDGLKKISTNEDGSTLFEATLTEQEVKVYGTFTVFHCKNMNFTKINTDTHSSLEDISLRDNHDLVEFNFKFNAKLETLDLRGVDFTKEELEDLVKNKLPGSSDAYCFLDSGFEDVVVDNLKQEAAKKGWILSFSSF
ncbi:MAG: hypothetical protein IJ417_04305, partial [Bacteroidaceae bacterium]|nr:hypothetical protein [Bacteroidaceae bacterium]